MGGISADLWSGPGGRCLVSTAVPCGGGLEGGCRLVRGRVLGTLLGFEATGSWPAWRVGGLLAWLFPALSGMAVSCVCAGRVGMAVTGLLFENYIVDASI